MLIMQGKEMMMKQSKLWRAMAFASLGAVALAGCGGSDGDDGKPGEPGEPGPIGVHIDEQKSVTATFTNATITDGQVKVDFTLENANGVAVYGLTTDHDLRFGISQLTQVSETIDDTEYDRGFQWQSFINDAKQPNEDWLPDDMTGLNPGPTVQANVEKACTDCLVDNKDGTYSYTFAANVANVTAPVAVTYNADATQRIYMELEHPSFVENAHYDFQPSTGATTDLQTRDVVSLETCYTCHQPESLAFHGGRRTDIENCVACHTPTSADPESGNSVDFGFMIHAIHKGETRHVIEKDADGNEVTVAKPYKIIGYGGGIHDYGKVMFPQKPAADCSSCHVEGDNAPADADLFKADKSNTACISCHEETPSYMHSSTDCMSCHKPEGYGRSAEEAHGDYTKPYDVSKDYSAEFTNIASNGSNGIAFDVQLFNDAGEAIAKEFVYKEGYSKPYIVVSWDIDKDYPAYEDGSKYSERRIDLYDDTQVTYDAATKTFSVSSANIVLPADINGKTMELLPVVKTCFQKGGYGRPLVEPKSCYEADGSNSDSVKAAYIQDEPKRFVWNNGVDADADVAMRRDIIDEAKCQSCHGAEYYHDSNGVNCQACHTADKSTKTDDANKGTKKSTSFAYKAHKADGHYLKYAGVGSGTVLKTDCATCHTDNGIELGRSPDRVWRFATGDNSTGGAKDIFVSSDAGTCFTCHQKYLGESALAHMTTYGAVVDAETADEVRTNAKESCATCHSPEQLTTVHGH